MQALKENWPYFVPLWLLPIALLSHEKIGLPPVAATGFIAATSVLAAVPYFRKRMTLVETWGSMSVFLIVGILGIVVSNILR